MNDIVNIISTVGFPIFCVIALGLFIYKTVDKITQMNAEREKKLYEMLGETRAQLSEASELNEKFISVLNDMTTELKRISEDLDSVKRVIERKEK